MKKIVGFVGSPRKGGNTELLIKKIFEGAEEKGAKTTLFHLNDFQIKGCQSCYACRADGICKLKDELNPLLEELKEADVIIIGSPVYMWQMTGQTKTFIDRLFPLLNPDLSPRMEKKKDLILVYTHGHPNLETFRGYFESTKMMLEFLGFSVKEVIGAGGIHQKGEILKQEELILKAKHIGRELISS